jgi:hypothetical protein
MTDIELLRERLVFVAHGFVGEKELPRNSGFERTWMNDIMTACGFVRGFSWCMITVEAIYRLSIGWLRNRTGKRHDDLWKEATGLIDPSTQQTYNRFLAKKDLKCFSVLPASKASYADLKPGDIVIFVRVRNQGFGHAGIVVEVGNDYFLSVEGNTNASGSANGDGVYLKRRTIERDGIGLDVRGFIQLVSA